MIIFKKHIAVFTVHLLISTCFAWENLPAIPTGRRTQFLLLEGDGAYRYGYDTGIDSAAKQGGDSANQVEGHYFYTAPTGQKVDLKYTAGVQGFVPEGLDTLQNTLGAGPGYAAGGPGYAPAAPVLPTFGGGSTDDLANTGDASYAFSYDAGDSRRQESSDAAGNVQGSYSYSNSAGSHDLSYIAGSRTGFVATGGTLAVPNGLGQTGPGVGSYLPPPLPITPNVGSSAPGVDIQSTGPNPDGSYSFSYNAGDSTRQESGDANGNVQGSFSFQNEAGNNDLSYIAGAGTGFVPTGGTLAVPNGLGQTGPGAPAVPLPVLPITPNLGGPSAPGVDIQSTGPNPDGSYSFSYNAGDSTRQESGDGNGNVQGSFSFRNEAGNNDLSYVAGSATGFLPTGGTLAVPNGLGNAGPSALPGVVPAITPNAAGAPQPGDDGDDGSYRPSTAEAGDSGDDGSYRPTGDEGVYTPSIGDSGVTGPSGTETGDTGDDGSYRPSTAETGDTGDDGSYRPSIGDDSTGQIPIGQGPIDDGSFQGRTDPQAGTGDASYSFTIDTDDYKRQESSDAAGNVQGSFTYKNSVGTHDLQFVAGSETGFLPIGGTLAVPPGLTDEQLAAGEAAARAAGGASGAGPSVIGGGGAYLPPIIPIVPNTIDGSADDQANTGDASYSFSFDTPEYTRQESSDAAGNVQGTFLYKNTVGTHDLSFVAGSATGFLPTGGTLGVPPGLTDDQLNRGAAAAGAGLPAPGPTYLPPQAGVPSVPALPAPGPTYIPPQAGVPSIPALPAPGPTYIPPQAGVPSVPALPAPGPTYIPPQAGVPSVPALPAPGPTYIPPQAGVPSVPALPAPGPTYLPPEAGIPSIPATPAPGPTYLPPQVPAARIPVAPAGIPGVKTYLPPNDRQKYGYIYDTK